MFSKKQQGSIGVPFDPNGSSLQIGVDPNTLKPKKNLSTLDSKRVKLAHKYAADQSIEVQKDGTIIQGHHRTKYAIDHGISVDVDKKNY